MPRKTISIGKLNGEWRFSLDLKLVHLLLVTALALVGLYGTLDSLLASRIDRQVEHQITVMRPEMITAAEKAHNDIRQEFRGEIERERESRKEGMEATRRDLEYIRARVDAIAAAVLARR